jgi:hypothetical protein
MRFTIQCNGLTHKEGQQIIESLLSVHELDDIEMRFSINAAAGPLMSIAHFEIWANIAKATAWGAGLKLGQKVSEELYKQLAEEIVKRLVAWMKVKMTKKSVVPVAVKLYGPDGELIKGIESTR